MSVGGLLPGGVLPDRPRAARAAGRPLGAGAGVGPAGRASPAAGRGEPLDLPLEPGRRRFFPLPIVPATRGARWSSSLSDAVAGAPGRAGGRGPRAPGASGRELPLPLRAGVDTAEWAYDRPDVRARVRPPPAADRSRAGRAPGRLPGPPLQACCRCPAATTWTAIAVERLPGAGRCRSPGWPCSTSARADAVAGASAPRYVSDTAPLPGGGGHARRPALRGAGRRRARPRGRAAARRSPTTRRCCDALGAPHAPGIDPRREALATAAGRARASSLPADARASRAEVVRAEGGGIDVRAEGPGLLVVAEAWDRGWSAALDGGRAPLLRVEPRRRWASSSAPGLHRVVLRYRAAGLALGCPGGAARRWPLALRRRAAARI